MQLFPNPAKREQGEGGGGRGRLEAERPGLDVTPSVSEGGQATSFT